MDLFLNYVKYLPHRSKKYETKLTIEQSGRKWARVKEMSLKYSRDPA